MVGPISELHLSYLHGQGRLHRCLHALLAPRCSSTYQLSVSKWMFKLLNEEGEWQELIHNKYLHRIVTQVSLKSTDSPFMERFNEIQRRVFQ
jgi:hypothetical protein